MARLLTLKAAWMMDTVGNRHARTEIAAIKVAAPNVALKVLDRAIQVHGGGGVSDDFGLASAYAHLRTLRLADGPDEVHKLSIARRELAPVHTARGARQGDDVARMSALSYRERPAAGEPRGAADPAPRARRRRARPADARRRARPAAPAARGHAARAADAAGLARLSLVPGAARRLPRPGDLRRRQARARASCTTSCGSGRDRRPSGRCSAASRWAR